MMFISQMKPGGVKKGFTVEAKLGLSSPLHHLTSGPTIINLLLFKQHGMTHLRIDWPSDINVKLSLYL